MGSNAVPGFLPSTHGFHFANRFPSVPAFSLGLGAIHMGIGNAAWGLCGGMCFVVRDRFERGQGVPPDVMPPAAGTPLFRELAHRQLDSWDWIVRVPLAFWRMALASPAERHRRTVADAWPRIRAEIDAGRLAMVGLVRLTAPNPLHLGRNHQVAAYGYDLTERAIVLRIYDPNHPDRDDVTIRISRAADGTLALTQSTGEPLFGLLALPFAVAR